MIHRHLSRAIQKNERRRSGSAIRVEVVLADRNRYVEQPRIKAVPHRIDVLQFIARRGMFDLRCVTVEPRRPDHLQSLAGKLRAQSSNDWRFSLTVGTPVRPEEKQHW